MVTWLDAVCALTAAGAKFPPLLGTGGNDGRLEFTNNFMQRVVNVIDPETDSPTVRSEKWLRAALFDTRVKDLLVDTPIGQFAPGNAGGPNAATGFAGESVTNPWDYILMLEGALVFSGAVTRRMASTRPGTLSYPFTVRVAEAGGEVKLRSLEVHCAAEG